MKEEHFEILSSNTFFHFTSSKENLLGILKYFFKPRYVLERTEYFEQKLLNDAVMAYPMVCFCDIPLSRIKRHIKNYGNYGIGLTTEWGFQNKLSPVIYTKASARTSRIYLNMLKFISENRKRIDEKGIRLINGVLDDLLMFTKPYKGHIGNTEVKFYDEREWRWIPDGEDVHVLLKEQYDNIDNRNKANKKLAKDHKLTFSPSDISYLIINEESEIEQLIESIKKIKNIYNGTSVKRLASRIITTDQIFKDF